MANRSREVGYARTETQPPTHCLLFQATEWMRLARSNCQCMVSLGSASSPALLPSHPFPDNRVNMADDATTTITGEQHEQQIAQHGELRPFHNPCHPAHPLNYAGDTIASKGAVTGDGGSHGFGEQPPPRQPIHNPSLSGRDEAADGAIDDSQSMPGLGEHNHLPLQPIPLNPVRFSGHDESAAGVRDCNQSMPQLGECNRLPPPAYPAQPLPLFRSQ